MKKCLLTIAIAATAIFQASAQTATPSAFTAIEGSKFTDNWSLGLSGGIVTPMRHHAFWGDSRGIIGLNLQKDLTPVFGLGIEAQASVNTSSWYNHSTTMFDHSYIGTYASFNLMNAFGGYLSAPRLFEMQLTAGAGWIHAYTNHGYPRVDSWAGNSWGTKLGLNFNFNLGKDKAWTIGFKPAILWNLGASSKHYDGNMNSYFGRFNANAAAVELMAGITYHFGNSNGTHSFVRCRLYDPTEIDALNATIHSLQSDLDACNSNADNLRKRASGLQSELEACKRRPPVVKEVTANLNNVRYIFFNIGSSSLLANQKPNLELVASSFKKQNGSRIEVKGYASPEGSAAFNRQLSKRRAEVVKNELVKKYNIDPEKISAEGMGVGEIFNVSTWNRVAVCTIK